LCAVDGGNNKKILLKNIREAKINLNWGHCSLLMAGMICLFQWEGGKWSG